MKRIEKSFYALVFFCIAIVCGTIGCIGQPFEARQNNIGGGYEESFPPNNFPSSALASTGVGGSAPTDPTETGSSSSGSSTSTGSTGTGNEFIEPEEPIEPDPKDPEQPADPPPPPPPPPVECNINADCNSRNLNVCQSFYCVDNKCVEGRSEYKDTPDQVLGDCHRNICNGVDTFPSTVIDDSDRPNDNNVCTHQWCLDGIEVVNSESFNGTACTHQTSGRPGVCNSGVCDEIVLKCRITVGEATGAIHQCPVPGYPDMPVSRIIYAGNECNFSVDEYNGPRCMPGDRCRINVGTYWWDGVCE